MDISLDRKRLVLSVGELARLAADSAEAGLGISLPLRGKLGAEAHRAYQEQRARFKGFRQEVHLDVQLLADAEQTHGWEIRIRGRLDGLIEELDRLVIEEMKTVALPPSRFKSISPETFPRHQRQLEIYLHLLALARPDKTPVGRLIYHNLPTGRKRSFEIAYRRADVELALWEIIAALIDREVRHGEVRRQKQEVASQMTFPFPQMRAGQAEMIEAITGALADSRDLLIEAPTGLGKTAAALFAALPFALERDKRVLFLTSKTTGQELVFETAGRLRQGRAFPRTLLLRARQKLCFLEDGECQPEECEYLEDFQQRLRRCNALPELLSEGDIHPDRLREIARRERLCPHALQIALAPEVDLIIGDYNYAFDPACRLESLFGQDADPSRLILIVDEAHNLPDRARGYYSPQLIWNVVVAAARKLSELHDDAFAAPLNAIQEHFEYYLKHAHGHADPCPIQLSASVWADIAADFEKAVIPYWFHLAGAEGEVADDPVLTLQRDLEAFVRVLQMEGDNFAHLLRRSPEPALEILCLDASPYLRETFQSVHAAIGLSATLRPFEAHARLLGLSKSVATLALSSPFPLEHCRVLIDPTVTTLYRERDAQTGVLAQRVQDFYSALSVNVLAFFPSFELMRRIVEKLEIEKLYIQEENLSDRQRHELLSCFRGDRHALLCSVMGGSFAEGIDLPGSQAEAAVIVGVPLPQVGAENELIRAYFERTDDRGFEYAYLYPGMRRAVQAAGRVIRSESDRGIILLLDRRYAHKDYQRLFPAYWYQRHPAELVHPDWQDRISSLFPFRASEQQ